MRLAAIAAVRNESDIVESFVRHHAALVDRIYILDHRSIDRTPDILQKLAVEGLPLALDREEHGIFYQGPTLTRLVRRAFDDQPWDFVLSLDSDEFIKAPDRTALETALAKLSAATLGRFPLVNYIPSESDDPTEVDVLRRIVHCAQAIPDVSCKIFKVVVPNAVGAHPDFVLEEGSHGARLGDKPVAQQGLEGLSLGHFPVRSINQFIVRSVLNRFAWSARSDYNPAWGWNYRTYVAQIKAEPNMSLATLTEAALLYADIYFQPEKTRYRKVLLRDPVTPGYDRLRYTDQVDIALLPPILDMMETLLEELRKTRGGAASDTPRRAWRFDFRNLMRRVSPWNISKGRDHLDLL